MTEILYRKVPRGKSHRYEPAALDWPGPLAQGAHLLVIGPGWSSARHNVEPAYAALLAASRVAEQAMLRALDEATRYSVEHQRAVTPMDLAAERAWRDVYRSRGEKPPQYLMFRGCSIAGVVQAGVEALLVAAQPTPATYPGDCAARCPGEDCPVHRECEEEGR